jgi:hypothetical protein
MAGHKGPTSLRPWCTRSGSTVAAIAVYTIGLPDRVVYGLTKTALDSLQGHQDLSVVEKDIIGPAVHPASYSKGTGKGTAIPL